MDCEQTKSHYHLHMLKLFEPSASLALVGVALWPRAILLETMGEFVSNPRADRLRVMQNRMSNAHRSLLDNMTSVIIPKSPPVERMTATEVMHKQEAARKVMAGKSLIPELWSQKLLEDFAKDGIMGNFLKPDLVGPDWPEYQGIHKQKADEAIDHVANHLARKIESDVADAITYGLAIMHIDVTS